MEDPQNLLGTSTPTEQLLPIVYNELRRIAAAQMAAEGAEHTLQATGLVHEAYLRLVGDGTEKWENRGHFFAAAAQAMRRILIDHARHKQSLRQGGGLQRVPLLEDDVADSPQGEQLLEFDEALGELAKVREDAAQLVELRVFAGLSIPESAQVLEVPERTARRTWHSTRAWLRRNMAADREVPEN